jgi:hypothetical protein
MRSLPFRQWRAWCQEGATVVVQVSVWTLLVAEHGICQAGSMPVVAQRSCAVQVTD